MTPSRRGGYRNESNPERRGLLQQIIQGLRRRIEGEAETRRFNEEERLLRIERAELRSRIEEIIRRLQTINEGLLRSLNSPSITHQPEGISQQMEREGRELISALETIKLSLLHISNVPLCAICMIEFHVGEEACQMFCHKNHIFHHDCLRRWLERKKECPLCKTPVPYPYHQPSPPSSSPSS
ncbi:probable E3 ubiquitin-protein ligase RHC1A [Cryptomeria japonica]|uniref:probable E3 ubiquitin-protein ligase RHC1A n=1 Tax=Cryptomeria japonica TaxID=3369 RepID=UPI0025AD461E|nr:probable E3 ubiquitin-protein ligase RHC1A [Cryptomeria japonica]